MNSFLVTKPGLMKRPSHLDNFGGGGWSELFGSSSGRVAMRRVCRLLMGCNVSISSVDPTRTVSLRCWWDNLPMLSRPLPPHTTHISAYVCIYLHISAYICINLSSSSWVHIVFIVWDPFPKVPGANFYHNITMLTISHKNIFRSLLLGGRWVFFFNI